MMKIRAVKITIIVQVALATEQIAISDANGT